MSGRCFWKTSDTRWKIRSETELARRKPLCIKEFRPRSQKNEKILYFLKKSVDKMADGRYNIGVDKEKRNLPNLQQAASLRPEVSEGNGTACFPTKEFLLEDS